MNSTARHQNKVFRGYGGPRDSSVLARLLLPVVLLAASLAAACGSASTNVVAPTANKCQITVSDFTRTFGAAGGTGTAVVTAARECSWSAASQASWISLQSAQGTGNGNVTYNVAPNQVPQGRSGALEINTQQLTVSQDAAPCRFGVTPASVSLAATGGVASVAVSATAGCTWSASTDAPWINLSGTGGSGNATLSFSAAANPGAARTATIVAAGQTVTVSQAAVATPPPPPSPTPTPPGCTFTVSPASLSFPAAGGQSALRVNTSAACAWTAGAPSWLTLSPAAGSGSASITVTAAANADTTARSGSIVIADQVVSVLQDPGTATSGTVQLTGTVSNKSGDCPATTFVVQGVTVVTNADTQFVNKPCNKVKNGMQVVVDGVQQPGQVLATKVTTAG